MFSTCWTRAAAFEQTLKDPATTEPATRCTRLRKSLWEVNPGAWHPERYRESCALTLIGCFESHEWTFYPATGEDAGCLTLADVPCWMPSRWRSGAFSASPVAPDTSPTRPESQWPAAGVAPLWHMNTARRCGKCIWKSENAKKHISLYVTV